MPDTVSLDQASISDLAEHTVMIIRELNHRTAAATRSPSQPSSPSSSTPSLSPPAGYRSC